MTTELRHLWRSWIGQGFSCISGQCRSVSSDALSASGSGYSAWALASSGQNASFSGQKIGESTQVWCTHSLHHCPEMLFWSLVYSNTHEKHASHHLWTLHAPYGPFRVYHSTRGFSFACFSWVHSGSLRLTFPFSVTSSGFRFVSVNSDYPIIAQRFPYRIIQFAVSSWLLSFPVRMPCTKCFTMEYSTLAKRFSYTVTSSRLSGVNQNSWIIW